MDLPARYDLFNSGEALSACSLFFFFGKDMSCIVPGACAVGLGADMEGRIAVEWPHVWVDFAR